MATLIQILEAIGTFVVGLVGRAGLLVVAGLVLAVPALAIALVWRFVADRRRSATVRRAGDLAYRVGAYHAPNHTWLMPTGSGDLAVGLDDLARRLLPSATAIELPRAGLEVVRGDPIAVVRSGGRAVQIHSPVDGRVVKVNRRLRRSPSLVRDESYGAGWMFTLAPADGAYMRFPHGDEAADWMRSERARLSRFVERELGLAAADGGELNGPLPALLGEEGWRKLVWEFLRA